jgi:FkbM family methyltransferase
MKSAGIIETREGWWVLKDDTHLSRWVEQSGHLWNEDLGFLRKYIPVGGTVVDAGASLGDHAFSYAEMVGEKGRVVAFEPQQLSFECLKHNMRDLLQVSVVDSALSDDFGNAVLHKDANVGGSHYTIELPVGDEEACSMAPLDHFEGFLGLRCDFIHLDLEGFEVRALRGARHILTHYRPVLMIEVNHGALARQGAEETHLRALLLSFRYDIHEIGAGQPSDLQRDIICTPK